MAVITNELKDKSMRRNFIEAKCSICGSWDEYSKNQVPIYSDGKEIVVVCCECR